MRDNYNKNKNINSRKGGAIMGEIKVFLKPIAGDSLEVLRSKAKTHIAGVIDIMVNKLGNEPTAAFIFCSIAARIGVMGCNEFTPQAREFVIPLLNECFKGVNPAFFDQLINQPIDERCYKLIVDAYHINPEFGDLYVQLIDCFDYIDGALDATVHHRISEIIAGI